MSLKQDDLDRLERKYAMYVLLAVDKHPMSTKTDIMRLDPGNEKTKFTRLNEMVELGLIEYKADTNGITKMVLSPEGQDIVNKIKKIRLAILKLEKKPDSDESKIETN